MIGNELTGELSCSETGLVFSLPEQISGRAIALPPALASASALAKCLSFYVKVCYVVGKALACELSCSCDRSCFSF